MPIYQSVIMSSFLLFVNYLKNLVMYLDMKQIYLFIYSTHLK